jgi:hypothetical protein
VPKIAGIDASILSDAYVYLLGRALVIRQEHADLAEPGISYNTIKYNPLGSANFVNPNLDVAYLEAWIAVDDQSAAVLDVPAIADRYYTAQVMDEWGEVIANVNEREFPFNPHGSFALVAPGSSFAVPDGITRIELHSRKAKLLARVELKTDEAGALALQRQFTLRLIGQPVIAPAVPLPLFDNRELIGVEVFDHAEAIIASALDVSPVAARLQASVRAVAQAAQHPGARAELDEAIRTEVIPGFLRFVFTEGGVYRNGWLAPLILGNYGAEFWIRTGANYLGIWANTTDEVVYYVASRDADGQPLDGSNTYLIDFGSTGNPDGVVDGYWSVILVDVPGYRVVPNPMNRFNLNSYSPLTHQPDGSLRLWVGPKLRPEMTESNWLPSGEGQAFSLNFRTYIPKDQVRAGTWFPPALQRLA